MRESEARRAAPRAARAPAETPAPHAAPRANTPWRHLRSTGVWLLDGGGTRARSTLMSAPPPHSPAGARSPGGGQSPCDA